MMSFTPIQISGPSSKIFSKAAKGLTLTSRDNNATAICELRAYYFHAFIVQWN